MAKETAGQMRLDKFLSTMNQGSRSQIKEMARKGMIRVNGEVCKTADIKIHPESDDIFVGENQITYQPFEYYMMNKPKGVVSATQDNRCKTVIDLIHGPRRRDLFPVGRLDIDTEGLLLITNDGDLAHRLLTPKKHVDKVYFARIAGKLPDDAVERFLAGVVLEDGTVTLPARLAVETADSEGAWIRLTIQEGKFHQVKRMFEALGCRVTYLKRLSMGPLKLDQELAAGSCRKLTAEEIKALKGQGI